MTQDRKPPNDLHFANYAVCYIDLLGQREALKDQHLLPHDIDDPAVKEHLVKIVRASIGSIVKLQEMATNFVGGLDNFSSGNRELLPEDKRELFDRLKKAKVKTQRWSDGLMLYASFGDPDIECPVNNIYQLFVQAGALCILALARKTPLRGAIEMAWATELHENELYGAAVARAYELENYTANYPRIVVGEHIVRYLEECSQIAPEDETARYERAMAVLLKGFITNDCDGVCILHYLGRNFASRIFEDHWEEIYSKAADYIVEQQEIHSANKNSKLAFKYSLLSNYFKAYPPSRE